MEILGIGPGEFLLILIVLLVVVGPERLPDLARQAGKLVVRARNWIQSSPDAALVLRARQEIEQELAGLKASLLEVQSVRDEVLGAARQIEDSVGSLASTKLDLDDVVTIAPPKPAPLRCWCPTAAQFRRAAPAARRRPTRSPRLPPIQVRRWSRRPPTQRRSICHPAASRPRRTTPTALDRPLRRPRRQPS